MFSGYASSLDLCVQFPSQRGLLVSLSTAYNLLLSLVTLCSTTSSPWLQQATGLFRSLQYPDFQRMLVPHQHSESVETETIPWAAPHPKKPERWIHVPLFFPTKGEVGIWVLYPDCTELSQPLSAALLVCWCCRSC